MATSSSSSSSSNIHQRDDALKNVRWSGILKYNDVELQFDDQSSSSQLHSVHDRNAVVNANDRSAKDESNSNNKDHKKLAKQENMEERIQENRGTTNYLKWIVLVTLVIAGCVLAWVVYHYTNRHEVEVFYSEFDDLSMTVIRNVEANVLQWMEAISLVAFHIQTYANSTNQSWPYVTIPNYEQEIHASKTSLRQAMSVDLYPVIVLQDDKEMWEDYSIRNSDWINASYDFIHTTTGENIAPIWGQNGNSWYDELWGSYYTKSDDLSFERGAIANRIYTINDENNSLVIDESLGPYFPLWQSSPMDYSIQGTINSNNHETTDVMNIVYETGKAVMGSSNRHRVNSELATNVNYPIFDTSAVSEDEPKVVALLSVSSFWTAFLENSLPSKANPIRVVIESTCNSSSAITVEIKGGVATVIGVGDDHHDKYDDMVVETRFGKALLEPIPDYTAQPLHDDPNCHYDFKIYPTQEMEDSMRTWNPIIGAITICFIFIFTILVFLLYNYAVERRQKKADQTSVRMAAKSKSNMSCWRWNSQSWPKNFTRSSSMRCASTLDRDEIIRRLSERKSGPIERLMIQGLVEEEPIAESHPESSVLFAEIAGFTKWSSDRSPGEVFQLLEKLYNAFDELAEQQEVFKIETIGDRYVAVTGIPSAQSDHALLLTNFANDLLKRFSKELEIVAPVLGFETLNLSMRIGIHSGPVISGVIRGAKTRFQLFGDSIHTASCMESTGIAGKIQVSQATADRLIAKSKGHWLTPREDTIEVYGKVKMQTYWVDLNEQGNVGENVDLVLTRLNELMVSNKPSATIEEGHDDRKS